MSYTLIRRMVRRADCCALLSFDSECTVIPSRDWSASRRIEANGQETSEVSLHDHDSQPSLLGLSLRLCNPDGALEKVCQDVLAPNRRIVHVKCTHTQPD